ncbi:MAG: YdcF family protein, partial [Selenomonadales bacterium]|nr:YdcF family protein [Selenomonadales bacterium]
RDKYTLLKRIGDLAGREYLEIEESSPEAFYAFFEKHGKLIIKPRAAALGRGIRVIEKGDMTRTECDKLRNTLIKEGCTLAEEFIKQHEKIDRIYDKAVSIVKLHTLNIDGNVQIVLCPFMQTGANGGQISHGGFNTAIDRKSGTFICQPHIYPDHDKVLSVFQGDPIPFYHEAEALAIKTARLVSELTYISWDVAITENGPVIIEGNGASAAYVGMQRILYGLTGRGIRPLYNDIMSYYKGIRSLTKEKIAHITDTVFFEQNKDVTDIDILVVLGSSRCEYRIQEALSRDPERKARYILSGGNPCLCPTAKANMTEAEYMRARLLAHGVSKDNILIDNVSTCTKENIEHIRTLLADCHSTSSHPVNVGIVTGGFHMKRVFDYLAKHSFSDDIRFVTVPAYGEHSHKDDWYNNVMGYHIVLAEYDKCR